MSKEDIFISYIKKNYPWNTELIEYFNTIPDNPEFIQQLKVLLKSKEAFTYYIQKYYPNHLYLLDKCEDLPNDRY